MKARLNLLVDTSPGQLRAARAEFIEFNNHRRYHEGIGNVTPTDVYYGRREEIRMRREEQKRQTLSERFQYNLSRKASRATGEPEAQNRSLSDGLNDSGVLKSNTASARLLQLVETVTESVPIFWLSVAFTVVALAPSRASNAAQSASSGRM